MQHISFMQKLCRGIALVGQLGFSLIALILGLLTSASTALQFYRKLTAKKEKDNDTPKPPRGYGDHI